MRRCLLVVCALVLATGCATRLSRPPIADERVEEERTLQQRMALTLFLERLTRVWSVGYRVRSAGADLCGDDVDFAYGFLPLDREAFKKEYRGIADEVGVGPGLVVWHVVPGSPAAGALAKGDRITAIGAKTVSDYASFEDAMERPSETGELPLVRSRGEGEEEPFLLRGERACTSRVALLEDDSVNALADGSNVLLTTGMVRFVESDDEMALVLGHEVAHNTLGHLDQARAQTTAGLLVDVAVLVFTGVDTGGLFAGMAGIAFSEAFEADADYMGTYLAARAGYDVSGAPDFWRRMAVEHPGSIEDSMMATHPSTPERAVALTDCVEEIETKRQAEAPLAPEIDDGGS